MFNFIDSNEVDTSGMSLLEKWKAQRTARKISRKQEYIDENTQPTFFEKAWSMIVNNWLIIAIGLILWFVVKPMLFGGRRVFRRRKSRSNSGRSFYLRMQRAKARKRRK